ncbi:MAG: SDR family NAD(P)-dependent oxidoreductase [Alphaproteobacteria bacterium]|nr:SDR family NAD(P)-dependent oxidoreductase [Alphaproteobacteria bacterium]
MMKNVALITGGSAGIGAALARLLASEYGIRVFIVGRTLESLKKTTEAQPYIEYIQADISTDEGLDEIIHHLNRDQVSIRYLVSNAAVQNLSMLSDVTSEMFSNSINTNVRGPLKLITGMLHNERFLPNARILTVSSTSRNNIQKGMGLYAISKSALFTLTKALRKELEGQLLINSIYPGTVNGTNTAQSMQESKIPEILELRSRLKTFLRNNKQIRIISPEDSAEFLAWVLCNTSDQQFANPAIAIKENTVPMGLDEWDIRDSECYIGCDLTAGTKLRALEAFLSSN